MMPTNMHFQVGLVVEGGITVWARLNFSLYPLLTLSKSPQNGSKHELFDCTLCNLSIDKVFSIRKLVQSGGSARPPCSKPAIVNRIFALFKKKKSH
jgi:hypothetical protein